MQEGQSIRSSHYNARPLALQKVKPSVQEEVVSLLDKHSKGVRNTLRTEHIDILSRNKFYAIPRLGRDVPGFLVMRTDGAYFYNPRREETYRLRLRLSSEIRAAGTILIGTLYYFEKKLVLEDVYSWGGELVWESRPFEERWEKLREFFAGGHWVQDLYLQKNLEILPSAVWSLEEAAVAGKLDGEMGCDFVPSDAKRKRFFWFSGEKVARTDRVLVPAFKPEPRKPTRLAGRDSGAGESEPRKATRLAGRDSARSATSPGKKPAEPASSAPHPVPDKNLQLAKFRQHETLPDVYNLFHPKDSSPLGIASVQEFSTSQQLAAAPAGSKVKIRWNDEFEKYQILSLAK